MRGQEPALLTKNQDFTRRMSPSAVSERPANSQLTRLLLVKIEINYGYVARCPIYAMPYLSCRLDAAYRTSPPDRGRVHYCSYVARAFISRARIRATICFRLIVMALTYAP